MNDIEKRIEELTNELNYHNHKYYVDDAPKFLILRLIKCL